MMRKKKNLTSKLGKISETVEGVLQLLGQTICSCVRIQTEFLQPACELGVCNGSSDLTDS